jgi:uncharacterized protein
VALIPKGVVIARSRIGAGVFATKRFKTGQTIAKLAGSIVWYELLWKRGGKFLDNCIRFGPETYLDPGDNLGRYLNHSCAPNAALRKERNQLFLFAAAPIANGDEIVFDYSTTIGDDDIWTMKCHCGARGCRKRVRKFGSLPADVKEDYVRRGMVPGYILRVSS